MKLTKYLKIAAFVAPVALAACRGETSKKPPLFHWNLNMDMQKRFEAQEENPFFADKRSMRMPVEGTVSRGNLRTDKAYYEGINKDSSFVSSIPIKLTKSFLKRGQKEYDIYCTPCHGRVGDGKGIIMTDRFGFVPAPSYHDDRLRNVKDGYIYSVISHGIRNMPSYAHQIAVKDRWAIVSYVRALQRSQHVPEAEMKKYGVDLAALQKEYKEQQAKEQAQKEAIAANSAPEEISAARGKKIYEENNCASCHSRDGSEGIGPTHKDLMGKKVEFTDGSSTTVDAAYLKESIIDPSAKVVKGYDPVMPPYNYLSDAEVESLVKYLESLSNNQ